MKVLAEDNTFGWYHPWGIEALLMALVQMNRVDEIPFMWRHLYFPFLKGLILATQADKPHGVLNLDFYIPGKRTVRGLLRALRGSFLWDGL
jgi:hypothetical protein